MPFARVATVKNGPFCRIVAKCNDLLSSSKDLYFFYSPSSAYKTAVGSHAAHSGVLSIKPSLAFYSPLQPFSLL